MENGTFAPLEQMLYFPLYFQILSISKASKGPIMEYWVKGTVVSPNIAQPLTLRTSPSDYGTFNQIKYFVY